MKALTLIPLLSITLVWSARSQTTNISGIVNSYYGVTEILPSGGGIRTSSTAGLSQFDMVMIVQMKGASVLTNANSSSFGDTTSLNEAGNYEIGVICNISGDSVFLFHTLANNYSVTDKVQLVRIPEYYAANVVDTLRPAVWNNASGVGGVLAIAVATDLTLNAPVFADTAGYDGGDYKLSGGSCSNVLPQNGYAYNGYTLNPSQLGALKGEGAYEFATSQSGGRGAPANGGGGGNNHNNGGGGGANLSLGGRGGGNYSTTGCTTNRQGEAGKPLNSWGGTKIFMGGGGGAGHSNGTVTVSNGGGNGGGIIFMIVDNIIGNNQKISANGAAGGTAYSDGASGGGAAGTIILNVNTYTGNLTVQADGGKGGNERDDGISQRCYGSGGGGSGGVIYFSGAALATTVSTNGGANGVNISLPVSCGLPVPALSGNAGSTITNYSFTASLTPGSDCSGALPVHLIYFKANVDNRQNVQLRWQVANPDEIESFVVERSTDFYGWKAIGTVGDAGGATLYYYTDQNPTEGYNFYRLQMRGQDGSVLYSPIQKVKIAGTGTALRFFPNPANGQVTITGISAAKANILVIDANGRTLLTQTKDVGNHSVVLDLHRLPVGLYYIRINGQTERLLIQRP